jgi:hypothetical protein
MKESTKKLLFLLLPEEENDRLWIAVQQLQCVVPQLSAAGFQSLLFLLEKREFIRVNRRSQPNTVSLTPYGLEALKQEFPAFSSKGRSFEQQRLLLFLEAPQSDRNFRFLRQLLLKHYAIPLTRAVFLYQGDLSEVVEKELFLRYKNSVVVVSADTWLVGDRYKIIGRKLRMDDFFSIYSGISNEIDRLISIKEMKKTFMDSEKEKFNLVYDRFLRLLVELHPLFFLYFPQVKSPEELLFQLRSRLVL